MRNVLLSGFLAAALVLAGFAAAFALFAPEGSGANGSWQTEWISPYQTDTPITDAREFIHSLPADCLVDFEFPGSTDSVVIAYSCS